MLASTHGAPTVQGGHRPELHGLRALAVLLVVVYHLWLGRVSGGVDVFFLISGFLLTGQLVRACQRGGIRYRSIWGRMISRLLPTTLTVLLVTIGASVLLLPENQWFRTIRQIAAAALFLENWQLVHDSTDYFAAHDDASVVQHFWSLSVQGQFYVVWPLLVGAVAFIVSRTRRVRLPLPAALAALETAVFVGSLAYSVWLTGTDQPTAYFSSLTRGWEFALGGLLALVIHVITPPRPARVALGWLGLLGLLVCGLVLEVGTVFPGYAALWPAACAAAVLVAGVSGSRLGADRLLTSSPARFIGDISFVWYLWHWPVLVLYLVTRHRGEPGFLGGCAVIAVSLLLATLTHRLVEAPFRESGIGVSTRGSAHRFAAAALSGVLLIAGGWQLVSQHKAGAYAMAVDDPDHPGARAMSAGYEYWGADDPPLVPAFVAVSGDWATTHGLACALSPRGSGLEVCTSETSGPPARRIAVVGDSRPTQFLAALRRLRPTATGSSS